MNKFLTAFIFISVLLAAPAANAQTEIYIKVKSAKLKASPQFWAASTADLSYGNALTVLGSQGSWLQARSKSGRIGYIHESAVSERKIELRASGSSSYAGSSSDVVLAGKGFNKEVEKQFAGSNPSANFREVDNMEKITVRDADVINFLKSGGLKADV